MKRLLAFGLSLGLVAAIAAPVAAGGSADKATGDVDRARDNVSQTEASLVFNAHQEKDGRPAKGMAYAATLGAPDAWWEIDVTCAWIDGNIGLFGGPVVDRGPASGVSGYVMLKVLDDGEPGETDYVWSAVTSDASVLATHCTGDNQAGAGWSVVAGNIQVYWNGSDA